MPPARAKRQSTKPALKRPRPFQMLLSLLGSISLLTASFTRFWKMAPSFCWI